MIDILVLNYNDAHTTTCFVESVRNYSCVRKVLVVDNHSTDDSFRNLKIIETEKVLVVDSGKNGGYGAGNNFGVKYLCDNYHSEHILVCNPDVFISEEVLLKLSYFLEKNNEYAVVAPLMRIPNSGDKYSAFKEPSLFSFIMSVELVFAKIHSPMFLDVSNKKNYEFIDVFSVAGSLFMIDARKIAGNTLYDEEMFLFYEEIVLGKKIKKYNYKIALIPGSNFIHNHSVSISKTYKSVVKKHLIYLRSYRYVAKKYFDGNLFSLSLSYVMSFISLIEIFFWSFFKRNSNKR